MLGHLDLEFILSLNRYNDIENKSKIGPRGVPDEYAVEAFSKKSMGAGRMIYSGRKKAGVTKMTSLFDMCMTILGNHIDDLEEVGGQLKLRSLG